MLHCNFGESVEVSRNLPEQKKVFLRVSNNHFALSFLHTPIFFPSKWHILTFCKKDFFFFHLNKRQSSSTIIVQLPSYTVILAHFSSFLSFAFLLETSVIMI